MDRFLDKIIIGDDCWIWIGAKNGAGRALFDNKSAARESYRRFRGTVPSDINVLHKCDNPACVRPAHLFLGTQLDNVRDMIQKGRNNTPGVSGGEKHPLAKLTWNDVKKIRALSSSGATGVELSKIFKIGRMQISRIIRKEAWTERASGE